MMSHAASFKMKATLWTEHGSVRPGPCHEGAEGRQQKIREERRLLGRRVASDQDPLRRRGAASLRGRRLLLRLPRDTGGGLLRRDRRLVRDPLRRERRRRVHPKQPGVRRWTHGGEGSGGHGPHPLRRDCGGPEGIPRRAFHRDHRRHPRLHRRRGGPREGFKAERPQQRPPDIRRPL